MCLIHVCCLSKWCGKKNHNPNHMILYILRVQCENHVLCSSATILSQSSCTSAPFRTTVLTSSIDSASPELGDKRTRRISARDGSSILEKFQRPTIDDISPGGLYNFTKIFLTNTSIRPKKNMCVYGHPTDPNFCWRLLSIFTQNLDNHFCCLISSNVLFIQPLAFCRN